MNYSLYLFDGKGREITNPTQSEIGLELDALKPITPTKGAVSDFIILSRERPVKNGCQFVQTLLKRDGSFLIEARFEYGAKEFEQYQRFTKDINEVKENFRMFALGVSPNITRWTDITKNILASNVKQRRNQHGKLNRVSW